MNPITAEEAFKLLGLDPACTEAELQKAYHKLSRESHPRYRKGGFGNASAPERSKESCGGIHFRPQGTYTSTASTGRAGI